MAQNPHPRAIDMSSPNFEQLHSKNIDDLYEVLGRSLVSPEYPGAAVVTKQVATQRGRAFVSGSLDKLRTKICVDWHYCDKRNQYVNFQALANAVAPLVSSAVGVPIATAMALSSRRNRDDIKNGGLSYHPTRLGINCTILAICQRTLVGLEASWSVSTFKAVD